MSRSVYDLLKLATLIDNNKLVHLAESKYLARTKHLIRGL